MYQRSKLHSLLLPIGGDLVSRQKHFFRTIKKQEKLSEHEAMWGHADRLSKADFGVRYSWTKLPKWQERWLVNFYQDWFDAIEHLTAMWNGETEQVQTQTQVSQ